MELIPCAAASEGASQHWAAPMLIRASDWKDVMSWFYDNSNSFLSHSVAVNSRGMQEEGRSEQAGAVGCAEGGKADTSVCW